MVAFGAWAPVLIAYAVAVAWPNMYAGSPDAIRAWIPETLPAWISMTSLITSVILGLVSVFCSVMVYVDTQRAFWSLGKTLGRFGGTMLLGGFGGLLLVELMMNGTTSALAITGVLAGVLLKSAVEISQLLPARASE